MGCTKKLKNDDFGAGFLKFGSGVIGDVFTNSFEDFGISGFGHIFGINQTEAGELADDFNYFDFLGTGIFDDYIKFGLFFYGFSSCCCATGGGRRRREGGHFSRR